MECFVKFCKNKKKGKKDRELSEISKKKNDATV